MKKNQEKKEVTKIHSEKRRYSLLSKREKELMDDAPMVKFDFDLITFNEFEPEYFCSVQSNKIKFL